MHSDIQADLHVTGPEFFTHTWGQTPGVVEYISPTPEGEHLEYISPTPLSLRSYPNKHGNVKVCPETFSPKHIL